MQKSVLLFTVDGVGGAERVTTIIGKILIKNGFDVTFCVIEGEKKDSSIIDFIPSHIPVVRIKSCNPFLLMLKIQSVIHSRNPKCIFASCMYLNTKILPFKLLNLNKRFIIRSENYLAMFSFWQRLLMGLTYRLADSVIAQNQEMKDEMIFSLKLPVDKVTVLLNPIDIEDINSKLNCAKSPFQLYSHPLFVASGRFAHQKGFDILVQSFNLVLKSCKQAHLFILGDKTCEEGKIYNQIQCYLKQFDIEDRVHCVGFQKNPYSWIKYADCFVLSSRMEGLPNVMLEALYMGKPVAATNCIPIIERIVKNGYNGYLAEVNNVESLAKAMVKASMLCEVESDYVSATSDDFVCLFS